MTRDECLEAVRGPGKFEGQEPYVPYLWDAYLNGMADRDDGKVLTFRITDEDRALFPELKGKNRIRLMETDYGFVVRV